MGESSMAGELLQGIFVSYVSSFQAAEGVGTLCKPEKAVLEQSGSWRWPSPSQEGLYGRSWIAHIAFGHSCVDLNTLLFLFSNNNWTVPFVPSSEYFSTFLPHTVHFSPLFMHSVTIKSTHPLWTAVWVGIPQGLIPKTFYICASLLLYLSSLLLAVLWMRNKQPSKF